MLRSPASKAVFLAAAALTLAGCHASFHWSGGTLSGGGSDPAKAAEDVLQRVAQQGAGEAYSEMAPSFRAVTGPNAWVAMVKAFDLGHFRRVVWDGQPEIAGNSARLKGQLMTPGMVAAPISIDMVRDGDPGFWRIAELHLHRDRAVTAGDGMAGEGAPVGTPMLIGNQLGEACRKLLASTLPFSTITCVDSIPMTPGASSLCMGFLGNRVLGVSARVNSYDPSIQDVNLHCEITDPIGPAAIPAPGTQTPPAGAVARGPGITQI